MKPLDDLLPEERDPQYAELITLLQQANHSPMLVDPTQRAQLLSRARARLMQTDLGASLTENMPGPEMRGLASPPSKPEARAGNQHRGGRLVGQLNVLAAIMVVTVLLGTALLIFGPRSPLHVNRNHSGTAPFTGGQPQLTVLTTQASIGQTPELNLSGFTPKTSVRLTHDGEKLVQTTTGASLVTMGQDGTALVEIFVDRSFLAGFHEIEAQDTTTHLTAKTTLRIVGANPTRLPQLAVGATSLDMGAGRQGTKSVQHFLLENIGGGSLTWSVGGVSALPGKASRLPSWLAASPPSGSFSQSETITLTADRGTFPPDDIILGHIMFYPQGTPPSFESALVDHLVIRVMMYTLPSRPGPIIAVAPLSLSFNAIQGQSSPPAQVMLVTNTGEGKLHWGMGPSITMPPWLSGTPMQGVLSPGQTARVTLRADTKGLTTGTYGGSLAFSAVDSHGNSAGGTQTLYPELIIIKGTP